MSYINNKKAQTAFQEIVLIAISLVIIGVTIVVSTTTASTFSTNTQELIPNINYKFPQLYVNSFLLYPLSQEDTNIYFPNSKQTQRIRDLIYLNPENLADIINQYQEKYESNFVKNLNLKDPYELYKTFSKTSLDKNSLLILTTNLDELSDIDKNYFNSNYVVIIQNKDKKFTKLEFKN